MRLKHRNDGSKVYSEFVDIKDANGMHYQPAKEDAFRMIFCKVTYNDKSEIIKMPLVVLPSFSEHYKLTYNGEKQTFDYLKLLDQYTGEEKDALKILYNELGKTGYVLEDSISLSGNEATDVGDYVCKVSFKD